MTTIDEILTDGDLPNDVLLGRLVLFTITDEPTKRDDLVTWFADLGLDPKMLPADIKPIDAFKKATQEADEKYVLPTGETAVVLCRPVETTTKYIKRQITREVLSASKKQLSYSRAIECTFFRGASRSVTAADGTRTRQTEKGSERAHVRVTRDDLNEGEFEAINAIATAIVERYKLYYENLDGNRLRATVRDYLKHLNALEIKAGCYFVHASKSEELAALQALVERLGGGCVMHTIPLVDIERERKMVITAFERESSDDLLALTREARELVASGNATPESYGRIKARLDELTAKAGEHMSNLNLSTTITQGASTAAASALDDLMKAI